VKRLTLNLQKLPLFRNYSLVLAVIIILSGCASGQAQVVGERIQEIEEVACPLTTIRNIERFGVRFIRVFAPDWELVCDDL